MSVTLMVADFIHGNPFDIRMKAGKVHLIITSPPYYNAREEYASWLSYESYLIDMEIAMELSCMANYFCMQPCIIKMTSMMKFIPG